MPSRSLRPLLPALVASLVACGGGSDGTPSGPVTPPAPPAVATVEVSGLPATMLAGETAQLTATLKDASGNALAGRTVSYASSDTAIATVSGSGLVTGAGHGAVTITATAEGKSGTAQGRVALTLAARRFAFAVVDEAVPGFVVAARSDNAAGSDVRAANPAPGDFVVTFGRLARADTAWRESVMLTAASVLKRCHLNRWGAAANGRDLEVSVSCYATDGTKLNTGFSLLVLGSGTLEGRHAFLESTDSSAAHTPAAARTYNSTGGAMSVARSFTGRYVATFNAPRTTFPENYFVSTLGGPRATCYLSGWNFGNTSGAACTSASSGDQDTRFVMQLVEAGRAGKRWGFTWNDRPADPVGVEALTAANYSRTSNGERVGITRLDVSGFPGFYRVRFPGLGALAGAKHAVQVSAYAFGRVTCSPAASRAINGGADLAVDVSCANHYDGAPANTNFTILIIE